MLEVVSLERVLAVGFTDLEPGGRSAFCSRLDWLTVLLAPGNASADLDPLHRPDGPGLDYAAYSALGLDKRMDAKVG